MDAFVVFESRNFHFSPKDPAFCAFPKQSPPLSLTYEACFKPRRRRLGNWEITSRRVSFFRPLAFVHRFSFLFPRFWSKPRDQAFFAGSDSNIRIDRSELQNSQIEILELLSARRHTYCVKRDRHRTRSAGELHSEKVRVQSNQQDDGSAKDYSRAFGHCRTQGVEEGLKSDE
jgi:hypothetical protein